MTRLETTREKKMPASALRLLLLILLAASTTGDAAEPAANYVSRVKPLLRERCYACHGALKQEAGLRLDTVELILRGGDSGPAVTKGNAAASRLIERVSAADADMRMPPEGEPLTPDQIGVLQEWISSGSPAPVDEQPEADPQDHWAFRKVTRPTVPIVKQEWVRNPIDAFVANQHQQRGLTPQPEATRLTLLRRLSLDLVGLPPSPAEIAAVLNDPHSDWYERTVDRLLDDPRHGQRWARHWMDIWRYSDWWGLGDQLRNSQKQIWHWRDWMVDSLNSDMPYDEMVRLMLAADELHPNDLDKLKATGYLARNYFLFNRHQWMDETVEHVSKAFLGLTMNCAKCHDHKYDPISHDDYYRMRAFFEPYHVRVDMQPGETNLTELGVARAFDGQLDEPTYRFIRGDEKNPDKSKPLTPGVPGFLEFTSLKIEPVELPIEASQPERRPWVIETYRAAAKKKREEAEAKFAAVKQKEKDRTGAEAELELRAAELTLNVAQAEERSVEQRALAMQASWKPNDSTSETAAAELLEFERQAARAEREVALSKMRLAVVQAELKLQRAAADKREAAEKELAAARKALEDREKEPEPEVAKYTKFVGAQWSATRFFNSGKDDPAISFPKQSSGRRKALAEWITHPENPLTARVAVNHLWTRHFGTPLVPTVFDFGRKGSLPANQELLDWLAAELVESGWSMKHLHRLIVESATYRMSSSAAGAEKNLSFDPENLSSWRRTPIRLESQAIRDSILALAGTLDLTMGGPPVPPAAQNKSQRRSLYFFHSNNDRNLFLTMFDEALVKDCYRREQSIVPQQALALTNSGLVLDAAPRIADRFVSELTASGKAADDSAFIRLAFAALLASEPNEAEFEASRQALDAWRKLPEAGTGDEADRYARGNLIGVLLNHNDFVTLN